MSDTIVSWMEAHGVSVTRENYIALNWSTLPDPWLPEHEAELPEQLQNWTIFG